MLTKAEKNLLCTCIDPSPFLGKRILITGASGMVGLYLLESLVEVFQSYGISPEQIQILNRKEHKRVSEIASLSNFISVIAQDFQTIKEEFESDYVIHLASPASPLSHSDSSELDYLNRVFLQKLIPRKGGTILFASSGEVYGNEAPSPIKEEYFGMYPISELRSSYPKAKVLGEEYIYSLFQNKEISNFKIARLFHTFGPGMRIDDGRSFADFLFAAASGKNIKMHSNRQVVRSFLYSLDAVTAFMKLLLDKSQNGSFNVGSEDKLSILDFAKKIVVESGGKTAIEFSNPVKGYLETPNQILFPDTSKLRKLGWERKVPLDQAIKLTLEWITQSKS